MKKLHHRKLRVWLPVLLLIIVVTVYTGNFMSLNSKFHSPQIKSNSMNQEIVLQGLTFQITEAQMLHTDDITSNGTLKELLAEYYSDSFENYILILITAELENRTASSAAFDFTFLHLESGAYSSQAFYPLMHYYNNFGMMLELGSKEKEEVIIGFPIHKVSFRETDWNNVENREYKLVCSLFPQKEIIPLEFEG